MIKNNIIKHTDHLQAEIRENIGLIAFNRPESKNALSDELTPALRTTLENFESDKNVRVIVITGNGGSFCSGGDVKSFANNSDPGLSDDLSVEQKVRKLQIGQEGVSLKIHEMPKPTVAVLPGAAAGAGMSIALACDIRIASEDAFLVPGFGGIGLSGDYGGSWSLGQLVGPSKAKDIYFSNKRISASEALNEGIVNYVVSNEELEDFSFKKAQNIAYFSPTALQYMKENHNRATFSTLKESLAMEADRMIRCFQTEDHKNAAKSFVRKEKPVFKGQ